MEETRAGPARFFVTAAAVVIALLLALAVRHVVFWRPLDTAHLYRNGPLFFGHRGSPKEAPENTIPSYARAAAAGLGGVEIDVVSTADGVVLCSHNHDLERETDGFGDIPSKTFEELQRVNAGVKDPSAGRVPLPRLTDVIDALSKEMVLNIEVKSRSAFDLATARRVVTIIRARALHGRVMISSFNPFVIGLVKLLDSRIPTAYIWSDDESVPGVLHEPRFIHLVHPDLLHPEGHLVNDGLLAMARRKGLKVNVWTVNNAPAIAWLLRRGVNGIISDFPFLMIDARARREPDAAQ